MKILISLILLITVSWFLLVYLPRKSIKRKMGLAIDNIKLGLYNNFTIIYSQYLNYDLELSKLLAARTVNTIFGNKNNIREEITDKHVADVEAVIKSLSNKDDLCILITKTIKMHNILYYKSIGYGININVIENMKKYGIWREIDSMETPHEFINYAYEFYKLNQ